MARSRRDERVRVVPPQGGPSLTKQAPGQGRTVGEIVKRFSYPHADSQPKNVAKYGDFSSAGSFQDALNTVQKARAQFQQLPAPVRGRFRNDPAELLRFVSDKANLEEAQKLGLLREEKVPKKEEPKASEPATPQVGASATPSGGASR